MDTIPLRLVGMCRVSTDIQQDNQSLQVQERDIRDYCRIHGHVLTEVFSGVETGVHVSEREQLRQAMQALREGKADGMIIWKLDRFARDVSSGLNLFRLFQTRGWQLVCVQDQIDTSTAFGKAFFQLTLIFSELERNTILARTRAGWAAKKQSGAYASGRAPYGWDAVNGQLVANDFEQGIIQLAKDMHARQYSLREIAEILNSDRVTTKCGKPWGPEQVKRIIVGPRHQNVRPSV